LQNRFIFTANINRVFTIITIKTTGVVHINWALVKTFSQGKT